MEQQTNDARSSKLLKISSIQDVICLIYIEADVENVNASLNFWKQDCFFSLAGFLNFLNSNEKQFLL